jgi:hypothetical protein
MSLIFDIETIGEDFEQMSEATKKSLTHWIKRQVGDDGEKQRLLLNEIKDSLGFSPLTGSIAAIGVYDSVKNRGVVYYQAPMIEEKEWNDENFVFKPRTEAEMLQSFWQGAEKYDEFVSFNGRSFDVPFLMMRSAVHRIKPSVNLMSNRYLRLQAKHARHIDLYDQMSYYGAVRRKGNLHLFCQALGIKSPKAGGITGDDINRLFKEQKYKEIAEYNSWDLIATWELFKIWSEYLDVNG